jgi:hypothetical protein
VSVLARHRCRTGEEAERLRAALAADTPAFVRLAVEGADLVIETSSGSAASVRATFEDLLPCLQAAERISASAESTRTAGRARPA